MDAAAEITDSAGVRARYTPLRDLRAGDAIVGGWRPWAVVERVEIDEDPNNGDRGRIFFTTHGPTVWFGLDEPFPVEVK